MAGVSNTFDPEIRHAGALMNHDDPIAGEIERAVSVVGRTKARALLREMRDQAKAKEKARKEESRKCFELGMLVVSCGVSAWSSEEVAGMLLEGKRHAEESGTMRLAYRKRGESFLHSLVPDTVH